MYVMTCRISFAFSYDMLKAYYKHSIFFDFQHYICKVQRIQTKLNSKFYTK